MNGMRARRFGGAVNYSRSRAAATPTPAPQPMEQETDTPPVTQHYTATSVEAPAPSINTAMPSVPNVQPTAPTAPTMQPTQAQGAAPGNGMTFGASPMTRPTPTQLNARPLPPAPGVTADPRTDPYAYIEQLYGRRETAAEKAERERREYNNQRIANWVSMLGALGNLVATSSSRYGRAVKSPDFAKAAAQGILTNELQRRDNEQSRLEAIRYQQQMDAQREKARRDADERAWNHAMRQREYDAQRKDREAADAFRRQQFAYQQKRDADELAFKRDQAKQQRSFQYSQLAERRKDRASRESIELLKATERQSRDAANRKKRDEVVLPHPQMPHGLHVAKSVWNGPTQKVVLSLLFDEANRRHKDELKAWRDYENEHDFTYRHFKSGASTPKPKNWFEEQFYSSPLDGEAPDAETMITSYLAAFPDSEASKRVVQMLQDMSEDEGDEAYTANPKATYGDSEDEDNPLRSNKMEAAHSGNEIQQDMKATKLKKAKRLQRPMTIEEIIQSICNLYGRFYLQFEAIIGNLSCDPYYDFMRLLQTDPTKMEDTPDDDDAMRQCKADVRMWFDQYTEWLQMREAVDAGTAGADEYGE